MKFSLKLPNDREIENPILKGKLPISIFNQPFSSSFTSAVNSSSDLSFSLSTNFLSGPCLKLTYSPTPSSPAGAASATPFSLCLKSGLGLFGSPQNSPLVFSARFSLSPSKPVVPTFSLLFKPQFGHFRLKKSTVSNADAGRFSGFRPDDGAELDSASHSNANTRNGFAADEATGWQELKLEPCGGKDSQEKYGVHTNGGTGFEPQRHLAEAKSIRDGIFSGIAVMARTVVPVTKRIAVNLRWGMNFPSNLATRLPYLTVNKISVERVEEEKEEKRQIVESDMELLKGMLFWMKNDMETLERENREMKRFLEEIRVGSMTNKVLPPSGLTCGELEPWKNNRSSGEERKLKNSFNGGQESDWRKKRSTEEENGSKNRKHVEKNGYKGHNSSNRVNEVESELERAIKAASLVKP